MFGSTNEAGATNVLLVISLEHNNRYSLDPTIVDNVGALVSNAGTCAQAAREGNLAALGACVDAYVVVDVACDCVSSVLSSTLGQVR